MLAEQILALQKGYPKNILSSRICFMSQNLFLYLNNCVIAFSSMFE